MANRKNQNAENPAAEAEEKVLNQTPPEGEEKKDDTPAENSGENTQATDDNAENPAAEADDGGDGEEVENESVPKFSKEQLLKSNWYSHRRDALNSLLDDDKEYSHAAVGKLIDDFMKGKVN